MSVLPAIDACLPSIFSRIKEYKRSLFWAEHLSIQEKKKKNSPLGYIPRSVREMYNSDLRAKDEKEKDKFGTIQEKNLTKETNKNPGLVSNKDELTVIVDEVEGYIKTYDKDKKLIRVQDLYSSEAYKKKVKK